ncbi:MAG: 3-phosphoshikimate 1-carboxyvinyltransferase, partial [Deltaproteobacteria bacterium]|nr:3-phosphoshikimate 1-carboxyvinyltransferase [Deltaproteobacteria bacterium]
MISVTVPSSKSISHRALIGAALVRGESVLRHVTQSDDIACTRRILCAVGARMEDLPGNGLRVRGIAGRPRGADLSGVEALACDVHESGSTCRLLTAVLAAGQGRFRVFGAPRMHERPIGALTLVLEKLGASVRWEGRPGYPPFALEARGLQGGAVEVGLDESSQYLSALLLAAPLCSGPIIIVPGGARAVSWPYVGLTLQTLEDFGIPFELRDKADGRRKEDWRSLAEAEPAGMCFHMRPAEYAAGEFHVEGDWSSASYFLAAGAAGDRPVRVEGLRNDSLQGDRAFVDILRRMGARVEEGEARVVVHPSRLRGIDADMGRCPDLVPTLAALAAFAQGETTIRNA